ncbi:MAG: DNA/RNA nuclease SfsA [Holosporaceae bacterium]|jgi:sugar fermentation stimulation protein A|nr:DNA/RNA nuclease SfsA [Holosporaceae bacterium]
MNRFTDFKFKTPLAEGLIKSRPNRFIMNVETAGKVERCHCPTTGKVGNVVFENVPCLLSKSENPNRKTQHTVEAFSADGVWIGINQTAVNRYVEHFLKCGLLNSGNDPVLREQTLGSSRLDFRVGNTYIEVKMPLFYLFRERESLEHQAPTSLTRFTRHINDLGDSLKDNDRAILLTCFVFNAPKFVPPAPSKRNAEVANAVKRSLEKGVEILQLNLSIDPLGVSFADCFDISSTLIK